MRYMALQWLHDNKHGVYGEQYMFRYILTYKRRKWHDMTVCPCMVH